MRWPREPNGLERVSNHPAARTLRAAREVDAGKLQQPRLPIECAAAGRPGVIGRGVQLQQRTSGASAGRVPVPQTLSPFRPSSRCVSGREHRQLGAVRRRAGVVESNQRRRHGWGPTSRYCGTQTDLRYADTRCRSVASRSIAQWPKEVARFVRVADRLAIDAGRDGADGRAHGRWVRPAVIRPWFRAAPALLPRVRRAARLARPPARPSRCVARTDDASATGFAAAVPRSLC